MTGVVLNDESQLADRTTATSPRRTARISGAFYLLTIIAGIFAEGFVLGNLVVDGDAEATAHNILASETLYRLGFVAGLISVAGYVVVTLLLYELLKPVNQRVSLLAAFFSIVGCATLGLSSIPQFAPLLFLGGAHYLTPITAAQLHAMAYMCLELHGRGYDISLVFFGFYCVLVGYLILRSTFLPRIVGALMTIAGLCYLTSSFASFLSPWLADHLGSFIAFGELVGEASLTLWLIAVGVNSAEWKKTAIPIGEANRGGQMREVPRAEPIA